MWAAENDGDMFGIALSGSDGRRLALIWVSRFPKVLRCVLLSIGIVPSIRLGEEGVESESTTISTWESSDWDTEGVGRASPPVGCR